jgi:hemerythrin
MSGGGIMWNESYAIGVEQIDNQHRDLFANVTENLLLAIQMPERYANKQYCISCIVFLKAYVVQHFRDEEDYQKSIGYTGYEAHKEQHSRLAQDVLDFERKLQDSNFSLSTVKRFLGFVLNWLMVHVAEEDAQIRVSRSRIDRYSA